MVKKKKIANRGEGRFVVRESLCVIDEAERWRVPQQCSTNFSRGATNQLFVESLRTLFNRCIFVHMVGRGTSHSCVIMKFIYHYTWSRQIIFNSQKLVKRR
jgi:hypothetical protein